MLYWIEYQDHPTFEKIFRLYDCYFSLFDLSSQCSLHSLPTPLFKCGNCKPFFTFAHYTGVLIPDFCLNTMMNLDVNNDPRRQRLFLNMYLQRMCSPRQMDLDYSLSQMLHIILSPTKVLVLWFSFWHIATRWLHGESVLGKDRKVNCRDQEPMGAWWSVFYSDHDAVCYGVFWALWNDPVDVRYCIFSHCTVFEPLLFNVSFRLFFMIHRSAIFQWPFFALISGIVIATVLWYLVNHFMRNQRTHSPEHHQWNQQ